MTRVEFYIFGETTPGDRLGLACRLSQKAVERGRTLHIHAAGEEQARLLDERLWTFRPESFVPHALAGSDEAEASPVVIGHGADPDGPHDVLINLAGEVPPFFSRYERVIEIVDHDAEQKLRARDHYRFYRDRGYPLTDHRL